MNRLVKDRYIPLRSQPLGDNHKTVQLLTSGQGLIYAAAFGAAGKQGKLRPLIQPFSLCEGEFYLDPVKKLWRLRDGTCLSMRDTFHQSLRKYYAALFWTELILKTHGGAGSSDFFQLTLSLMESLDESDQNRAPSLLAKALWIFLEVEGIQPDLNCCARCGRKAPENKAVCYDHDGHVVCSSCRIGTLPVLTSRGRSFLSGDDSDAESQEDQISVYSYLTGILKGQTGFDFDKKNLDLILGNS